MREQNTAAYVSTHASNEHDAPATLRDHVPCRFAGSEEGAVYVDIVKTLDTVKWVAVTSCNQ